jgi:predicted amidohydrolase YtcJ
MAIETSISRITAATAFAALLAGSTVLPAHAADDGKADVVFKNGRIYTVDPARSVQQALAITGNTISGVGSDADVAPLIGPATKVIDLSGKFVMPGMIDTHTHPIIGAINASKCSLADVKPTIEAIKPVIQKCLADHPATGDGWLEVVQLYNYGFEATAKDFDTIEADRPLAVGGNDGHTLWTNTRALQLSGVTAATEDPPGGAITRDASGNPTGAFADTATLLVLKHVPQPTVAEAAAFTEKALADMAANGLTGLTDAYITPVEAAVWRELYRSGRLPLRVRGAILMENLEDSSDGAIAGIVAASQEGTLDPAWLRMDSAKIFADGVIEAPTQTAALLAPYLDEAGKPTDKTGELYFEQDAIDAIVTKLDKAGLTVHVHAIGDRAVRASLDAFAAARKANGATDNRHQISHLQLVDPADFPRFAELGVIANFQLDWAKRDASNVGPIEPYLGPERYRWLYPAGSIKRAGAMIAGGSDWDVSSYDPFHAMEHGITRVERGSGLPPLGEDEALAIGDVIDAYTINAAIASRQDATTGSLEVGKRADLVILDRDITAIDPATLDDTEVLATWIDGKPVYERK